MRTAASMAGLQHSTADFSRDEFKKGAQILLSMVMARYFVQMR